MCKHKNHPSHCGRCYYMNNKDFYDTMFEKISKIKSKTKKQERTEEWASKVGKKFWKNNDKDWK